MTRDLRRLLPWLLLAGLLPLLAGCANLGYYWHTASGQLHLIAAARPVDQWLQDPDTPESLKDRLRLAQQLRAFASRELGLPDNPSYHRYADLHRGAAVWNVVAAPELSLTLKTWCFPVTGCVGYHGWFDEARAQADAAEQRQQGYEASVYPVPAYSTLGWMNWLGGDPLLNTFIQYPDAQLARLIFHELAHQVVYVKNDTTFNESFATAVERIGVRRWLAQEANDATRRRWADDEARRRDWRALTQATRARLAALYAEPGLADDERRARKAQALQDFREDYARLRERWGGDAQRFRLTDRWVGQANNASFGAQAAYDDGVPGFEALFLREGGDWGRFYEAVRALAAQPKPVRQQALQALARQAPSVD